MVEALLLRLRAILVGLTLGPHSTSAKSPMRSPTMEREPHGRIVGLSSTCISERCWRIAGFTSMWTGFV